MKMKKRWIGFLLAAVAASAAFPVSAFASQLTAQQAEDAALQYLPQDSQLTEIEDDWDKYEMKFYSEACKERYELDMSKVSGKLLTFESKRLDSWGSSTVKLTEAQAKEKVTGELEGAEVVSSQLRGERKLRYDVDFQMENGYGEYTIHPGTGAILEREITFTEVVSSEKITLEQAKKIALNQVPGATVREMKLDEDDGRLVYEGELCKGRMEYEFEIDAVTGTILSWDADYDD